MAKNDSSPRSLAHGKDARRAWILRLVILAVAMGLLVAGAVVALRPPAPDDTPKKQPPAGSKRLLEKDEAFELMKDGQNEAAIAKLAVYIDANPADVDARLLLAQALTNVEQYDKAEYVVDDIFRSLQAPLKTKLWWLKGELMRRRGEPSAKYMTFFQSATDQPDATPDTWSKYGQLLLDLDQPLEARDWCQRAYDAGLRDADTLRVLGKLALENDELELAQELLESAVEKEKNNPELWLLLVQMFRQMGREDTALATVQAALQGRPSGELWLELGQLLEARGEKAQAADAFAGAAGYRIVRTEASVAAARLYYDLGQFARAMRYIDQAHALWDDDPAIQALRKKIEDARFGTK